MKTVVIQIGNSDNKLTQVEWSEFVREIREIVAIYAEDTHFFGGPAGWEPWQNAAWIFTVPSEDDIPVMKALFQQKKRSYMQDTIAWLEGETQFI